MVLVTPAPDEDVHRRDGHDAVRGDCLRGLVDVHFDDLDPLAVLGGDGFQRGVFAGDLYPKLPRTISKNGELTGHDGIFDIRGSDVPGYVAPYSPVVLRWDRRTKTGDLEVISTDASKGSPYGRVLIFTTKPLITYYKTRDFTVLNEQAKFYVAVAWARHSTTFVLP